MYKQRLKEYIEQDQIYQDYKKGKEPAHNDGCSDFDWFCIEHCKDIEDLLEEAEELQEESYKLSELWCKSTEENKELHNKIEYLKNKIENKDSWCQLIADIGYDYDGYRNAENLMSLIDELVKYALYSRDDYDYEEMLKDSDVDDNGDMERH